jgi:hypothetical protein
MNNSNLVSIQHTCTTTITYAGNNNKADGANPATIPTPPSVIVFDTACCNGSIGEAVNLPLKDNAADELKTSSFKEADLPLNKECSSAPPEYLNKSLYTDE